MKLRHGHSVTVSVSHTHSVARVVRRPIHGQNIRPGSSAESPTPRMVTVLQYGRSGRPYMTLGSQMMPATHTNRIGKQCKPRPYRCSEYLGTTVEPL